MLTAIPLRAVIFDWDGTLLNSYHADARAYLKMFDALGIEWNLEDLLKHYSPDWHNVYRAVGLATSRWAEADRLWRHFYGSERPVLEPGARRALEQTARRYVLGLVSSGSGWRVRAQLRRFSLERFFAVAVYGDQIPRRKPHPAQLKLALARLGVEPAAAVYVGDTPEDVQMAHRAGVAAIAVRGSSPVAGRLRLARADVVIPRISDLPRLFCND